jgi:hypothetical protein
MGVRIRFIQNVWRKARDYVRYDLKEIVLPSSLPDPPGTEVVRKKIPLKTHLQVGGSDCRPALHFDDCFLCLFLYWDSRRPLKIGLQFAHRAMRAVLVASLEDGMRWK